jgi:site-specific DNA-methyltransferase (adenine-specific)
MADNGLFGNIYNPDVLTCLANLSNDEVFTPPDVANAMLDMLPQELFENPDTTFLDPACKSGVFLREIAKRLIKGLEWQIPDLQQRLDHIFHKQLFGIAITELTSLLSRRSLYCSKYPNSEYSVSKFDDAQGNIRYKQIKHTWSNGKCVFCGATYSQYERDDELETHAYEWIHMLKPEEIFNMKFDVIISNPPYHLNTAGAGRQAKPIYNLFVNNAKKLNPNYITMIIQSRWFSGGMGLDSFREEMKNDKHIVEIVDYTNSKECFQGNSISGGVCYFLWDKNKESDCKFTNIINGKKDTMHRYLDEFPILVRYNKAVSIIHKVNSKNEKRIDSIISSLMPYGLSTSYRGKKEKRLDDLTLYSSEGVSYIGRDEISKGKDTVDKYKILISKTSAEHAGEPDKDGMFKVIPSSMRVLKPNEVCTHSYFVVGNWDNIEPAINALSYMKTRFVRFLMLLCVSGFGLSKLVYQFVPLQDFSRAWTDIDLYKKYSLTNEEIEFIESMIKPME